MTKQINKVELHTNELYLTQSSITLADMHKRMYFQETSPNLDNITTYSSSCSKDKKTWGFIRSPLLKHKECFSSYECKQLQKRQLREYKHHFRVGLLYVWFLVWRQWVLFLRQKWERVSALNSSLTTCQHFSFSLLHYLSPSFSNISLSPLTLTTFSAQAVTFTYVTHIKTRI